MDSLFLMLPYPVSFMVMLLLPFEDLAAPSLPLYPDDNCFSGGVRQPFPRLHSNLVTLCL